MEIKVGDSYATINVIFRNAFHLNTSVVAGSDVEVKEKVGQILEQVASYLGCVGYGKVTEVGEDDFKFGITQVNDPKLNPSLEIKIEEGGLFDNGSQFIGPLD